MTSPAMSDCLTFLQKHNIYIYFFSITCINHVIIYDKSCGSQEAVDKFSHYLRAKRKLRKKKKIIKPTTKLKYMAQYCVGYIAIE